MHRLLTRQLKRFLNEPSPAAKLAPLLAAISDAYQQADQERLLIEQSLDFMSLELRERNLLLRQQIDKQALVQNELTGSLAVLNATFDATGEAILAFDRTGKITKMNNMATDLVALNGQQRELFSLRHFRRLLAQIVNPAPFVRALRAVKINPKRSLFGVVTLKTGQVYEYHSSPQLNEQDLLGRVWCFRDITELKENEALVHHQAFHDALTNLPNRALLDDRIRHGIEYSERFHSQLAVLFIDLDNFKKVNDNAGHQAGDEVLKTVAERVKGCIRDIDTLARLGGDEFVVLLENLQDHNGAIQTSHRIIEALSTAFSVAENDFFISSSIGISLYPRDSKEPDELMRMADMAMYHAKALGKGNYQFFDTNLERVSVHRLKIENWLRHGIRNREFELYFQPRIDLRTGLIVAVEALIRWARQDGRFIMPDDFIHIAEQTGLINEIGAWVLEEACQTIAHWATLGIETIAVAINVSPLEFRNRHVFDFFKKILQDYEIADNLIEIEITESLFLDNVNAAQAMIEKLRSLNITVAVDDFGTGHSSLKYLHQLPIDILKIDKSFITGLTTRPHDAAITDTIIRLAKNFNLKVVAEGVEDESTLAFLQAHGCDYVQGYYYHRPMQKSDITALLLKQAAQ
ncbi:putative bifunctional diguanylate cyclase/phosphodiesterase [Reinekea sp.]|jgi:diguanylate cyclase (GGDEF)-like protein|uniref:putative bifunctional diguanylate cyclase/phosphodiesterase n=1 Tax=Reinekea sp. TaxID=1970455 RepID=UPI002A807BFE|nr:EAL domain-containing protein [Reinekea sp.]